jgi:predicted nucleic acid-binding protein
MDVVVDADILSTFAKINNVRLLPKLFRKSNMFICPSVSPEIQKGIQLRLLKFSYPAHFLRIKLGVREKQTCMEIKDARNVSSGDAESLAVAKSRNCVLLTNDRKVQKIADSLSVNHLNLALLLRELWAHHVMTKAEVARLADEIERKDRIIIKRKELIFK